LKKLKVSNRKLFKDRKIYFNVITILSMDTPIIKTKGIRLNAESFAVRL